MKICITLRIDRTDGNVLIDYKARPIEYVFDDVINFVNTYNQKYCASNEEGNIKIAKIFEENDYYMKDDSNKEMIAKYGKIFAKKRVLSRAFVGMSFSDVFRNNDEADGTLLIDFDKKVITPNFFISVMIKDYLDSYFLGDESEKEEWKYSELELSPFPDLDNIEFINIEDFRDFMTSTELDGFRAAGFPDRVIMTKF